MCSKSCFGSCWGTFLLLLGIAALATPWYIYSSKVKDQECQVATLIGWTKAYCNAAETSDCLYNPCDITGKEYNWRTSPVCSTGCSATIRVNDATVGLLAVSFVMCVVVCVGFYIRTCGNNYKQKSVVHLVVTILGFVFSLIAMAYYAGELPKALNSDGLLCTGASSSPCKSFYGSYTDPASNVEFVWGGAGWIVGLFFFLSYIVAIIFAAIDFQPAVQVVGYVIAPDGQAPPYGATQGAAYQYTGH